MFRGRYNIRMEARGRFSVPSKIRELINVLYEGKVILSCGFFEKIPHLLAVPLKEWEAFEQEYPFSGILDYSDESFLMRLRTVGSCEEVRLDDHGRILLPDFMRTYAKLKKELSLVGMGKYMVIFSSAVLNVASNNAEKSLSKLRGTLAKKLEIEKNGTVIGQ